MKTYHSLCGTLILTYVYSNLKTQCRIWCMYAFSGEEMHSFYQTPQGAVWPPKGKEPLL